MKKKFPFLGASDVLIDFEWMESKAIVATFDGVSYINYRIVLGNWMDNLKPRTVNRLRNLLFCDAQKFGLEHISVVKEAHATLDINLSNGTYWAGHRLPRYRV